MDIVNLRFPAASLIFLLIIGIFYFTSRRLPSLSARAFTRMYFIMVFNIVFEFGTLYCLYNFDTTPKWLTYFAHVAFIFLLVLLTYNFFVYLYSVCVSRYMTTAETIFTAIPVAVFLVIALMGKISYYVDGTFVYSYGTLPVTLFVCIGVYAVASAVFLAIYRKRIERRKRAPLACAILFFIVGSAVQIAFPKLLMSSLSGSAMVFFIYLLLENPRENYNPANDCFNGYAFRQIVSEYFSRKKSFFVITVHLDNLGLVKTKFGQDIYDDFLAEASRYFSHRMKKNALVFHLRSNMLTAAMCCSPTEAANLAALAEKRFSESWIVDGVNFMFNAKMFLLECPKYAKTVDEILRLTDYFIHDSKQVLNSERCSVIIDDEFIRQQERFLKLRSIVKNAVENDGLDVFYQPIFSTAENKFTSAEALVRLKDKSLGFVSPEEFIPIAERDGTIIELGLVVMEKVCRLASERNLKKFGIEYIEVNLSGVQCMSPDIYEQLKRIMIKHNVEPSFINLEITETAAVDASAALSRNMALLSGIGCTFSLDDFGTGYSNMAQIVSMPLSIVKLDKSLIWGYFDESNVKLSITTANIINMVKQLRLEIVAEGVETKEQYETLAAMHVDHLQGYYFSRPIPENDFLQFIGAPPLTEGQTI